MEGRRNSTIAAFSLYLAIVAAVTQPLHVFAAREYQVRGMVLRVDQANKVLIVSHERIAGLMDSMTMPFEVRDAEELNGVVPGAIVEFTLVMDETSSFATQVRVRRYE